MKGAHQILDISFLPALPSPQVTTTMDTIVTASGQQALKCPVLVVPFLSIVPKLQWMGPNNCKVASGFGPSLTHILDPVRTSDAGQYTCQATVDIPSVDVFVTGQNRTTLTVQSESPDTAGVACAHLHLLIFYSPPTSSDCLCQPYHSPVCWHWLHPHSYCLTALQCGH